MAVRKAAAGRSLQRKFLDAGMAALLIGVLIAIGFLSAIVGMRIAVRRTEVAVPLIIGKTSAEAEKALAEANLQLEVSAQLYDPKMAEGLVISQRPAPGGRLKAKRAVQVVLSLGPRTNPVPKLVGATLRVARLTAAQYNYQIGHVSEMTFKGAREGVVVQQFPPPDSDRAVSRNINLLVSKGAPGRFIMPEVIGKNLNEVKPFFESRGFTLPSIEYRFYRNVVKGTVVKQFPEPGYLLTEGDTVNLEVAR